MFKDNKKLVAESIFIKEALKLNLSLNEFLLLLYFDNSYDLVFDIKVVAKTLNMKEEDVLNAYGSLMAKKIISAPLYTASFNAASINSSLNPLSIQAFIISKSVFDNVLPNSFSNIS